MKKIFAILVVMMFALSVATAFAGEGAGEAKGKPMSKEPGKGSFQAASSHIALWGKSEPMAKKESLRGNKAELAKRNGCK